MKKAVFAIALVVFLAACLPTSPAPVPAGPSPVVDAAGTGAAMVKTAVALTMTALPTRTAAQIEITASPTLVPDVLPSETTTPAAPALVEPVLAASTGTFEAITSTPAPATLPNGPVTDTLTPGVLTYGTLPPAVPFAYVTLVNKAKTQAYISLQVVTAEGGPTIIEYPVRGKIKFQAPVGNYLYVAWVGGREMVGEFKLRKDDDLEIFLYRDRIEIR